MLDVVVTEDIDRSLLGTVDDCIPGRLVRVVVVAAAEGALAECTAAAEPALPDSHFSGLLVPRNLRM